MTVQYWLSLRVRGHRCAGRPGATRPIDPSCDCCFRAGLGLNLMTELWSWARGHTNVAVIQETGVHPLCRALEGRHGIMLFFERLKGPEAKLSTTIYFLVLLHNDPI